MVLGFWVSEDLRLCDAGVHVFLVGLGCRRTEPEFVFLCLNTQNGLGRSACVVESFVCMSSRAGLDA